MLEGSRLHPTFSVKQVNFEKLKEKEGYLRSVSNQELLSSRILNVAQSPGRATFRIKRAPEESPKSKSTVSLEKILTPAMEENMDHLNQILESDPTRKKEILEFVREISKRETEIQFNLKMGKLIWLLDRKILKDLKDIDSQFDHELSKIGSELQDHLHSVPELELRTHISRAFVELLISSKGLVNFGIIPVLSPLFRKLEKKDSGFACNFENTLELVEHQTTIRSKIAKIKKPKSKLKNVHELIRVSLDIPERKLTSVDAKKAVLMALLSYPRQEHVANCFALSLAISLFSTSMEKCLDDFNEIMSHGCLRRQVEGELITFPFLLKLPLETVKQPLQPHFESNPLLHGLQRYLGIEKMPLGYKTIDDLLVACEKIKPGSLEKGRFYIEAQTKNPLIGVWSNILASMAEGGSETLLKTALVGSIIHVAELLETDKPVLTAVKTDILKRIHIHYDPEISSDGELNGGFVLYDKEKHWKRIDTPKRFHHFIMHSIQDPVLKEKFKAKERILTLLEVYHPDNKVADRSFEQCSNLPYTPWITKIGNDPKQLLKIYKGASRTESTIILHPRGADDLLSQVITSAKEFYEKQMDRKKRRSSLLVPVRIVGQHTFNLIVNHPSLLRWLINPENMQEIIRAPAKAVHESKYNAKPILNYLYERAKFKLKNPPETLKELRALLIKSFPADLIDRKLFEYLPETEKAKLNDVAIHFADTNWQQDGHDIHLAFSYNPASLALEVFEALDDLTILKPIDQESQIRHALWEFYRDPENAVINPKE